MSDGNSELTFNTLRRPFLRKKEIPKEVKKEMVRKVVKVN